MSALRIKNTSGSNLSNCLSYFITARITCTCITFRMAFLHILVCNEDTETAGYAMTIKAYY